MSYIDRIDHELVGYFVGLPLYHPLETISGNPLGDEDFNCTPAQLVLGGGSGEHPALVFKDPPRLVAHFLGEWLENTASRGWEGTAQWRQRIQSVIPGFEDEEWRDVFEFAGWSVEHYHAFCELCRSPILNRPFDDTRDECVESWLAGSIGEFVLFSLPELATDFLRRLEDVRDHVSDSLYANVWIHPPGYPLALGRKTKGEGLYSWGHTAWQIARNRDI